MMFLPLQFLLGINITFIFFFFIFFFFCDGNSTIVPTGLMLIDLTQLLACIKDRKFLISNWLLHSQSKGVDHGSSCAWNSWRYTLFLFSCSPFLCNPVFCCQKAVFPALKQIHYLRYINLFLHPSMLELGTLLYDHHDANVANNTNSELSFPSFQNCKIK